MAKHWTQTAKGRARLKRMQAEIKARKLMKEKKKEELKPVDTLGLAQEAQQPAVDLGRLQDRAYRRGLIDVAEFILRELR